jgi:hypothetical protein
MLAVEPILLLVTIYLSIVYGIIYASKLMVPRRYSMTLNVLCSVRGVPCYLYSHPSLHHPA